MRRYSLPLLSGVLMALAFYPFSVWPLALVALMPLYYFATDSRCTGKEVFWGGALAGVIFSIPLYYCTLASLLPGLSGAFYTDLIRTLSIPAAFLTAVLCGLAAWAWRTLRTKSPLLNALSAAACWVLFESVIALIFQGYNPEELSTALVHVPGALALSALSGAPLVSFAAAAFSIAVVQAFRTRRIAAVTILAAAIVLGGLSSLLLPLKHGGVISFSSIQTAPAQPFDLMLGTWQGSTFYDPLLRAALERALPADVVIYPGPPVDGHFTEAQDAAVGAWLTNFVPTSSAVLLWNTTQRGGALFTEYALWQGGREQVYQKHDLYALSDYSPWWAKFFGLEKSPDAITAGTSSAPFVVKGFMGAGLICSELHQDGYARAQGARADFLIADGLDAFFPGEIMGDYSLAVARYRAAELGEPVVRANLFGPSALIRAGGSVVAQLPYAARGVVRGAVQIEKISTPYRYLGAWPLYALIAAVLILALYKKLKSPDSADQE